LRFLEKDLRIKITGGFIVFIVILVVASITISHGLVTRIICNDINQYMSDSANLTRNVVEVALESRGARILLLANYPALRDPAATPESRAAALALSVQDWSLGHDVLFTDTNGNVISGTGKLSTIANVSGTNWFDTALSGGVTFTYLSNRAELSAVFLESPVFTVSAPVRDSKNQIFGYIVAFTKTSDITKTVASVHIKRTGHGFLVDKDGGPIAGRIFPAVAGISAASKQSLENLIVQAATGNSGSESIQYDGKKYLIAWTPVKQPDGVAISGPGWIIGVAVPTLEAYAPANQIAMTLLLFALGVLTCGIAASFFLGRSIVRPIDELVSSANRIGAGDMTGDIMIRTRDQVGSLATTFLRMRDYLRDALLETSRTTARMSALADEQSAGTLDVFSNAEDIVESAVVLARNSESQTQKFHNLIEYLENMPEKERELASTREARELLQESEILAEVGANKAIEIASAIQDQRVAARDVATAARRLSELARELDKMVKKFKI